MSISVPPYVTEVLDRLTHYGYHAYVVGGCVRDSLLGREPADWDVCTSATPEEMLAVFRRFRVFKTGLKHGTLTVRSHGHSVEVTTFRTDGAYTDNRHPDAVSFVTRVEDDLARRDFTINAMAYHPQEGLVDAFGGQQDLAERTLRCVGEPDVRFNEDGLRLLRALRFAARFGLSIERETAYSIHRNRHLLENISAERIFKELQGILVAHAVGDMLTAFPDVFTIIMPELEPLLTTQLREESLWAGTVRTLCAAPAEFSLRLALLLHHLDAPVQAAKVILRRLKSDNSTAHTTTTLLAEAPHALPAARPAMRRLIGRIGEEATQQLFTLRRALLAELPPREAEDEERALRHALLLAEDTLAENPRAFTVGDLAITGRDLMESGMPAGPQMGHILATLLDEVQEERLENTRAALLHRAAEQL